VLVPFVPILIGLLALGLVVLLALALKLRGSVRRFGMVRGWLEDYLTDRSGFLRARFAALGIAVTNLRQDLHRNTLVETGPRTIDSVVEREDHRA
jgi:hypothetical protein